MENITKENCLKLLDEHKNRYTGAVDMQAGSWKIVHRLCIQLGMSHEDPGLTGIERVVDFIHALHEKATEQHP